MKKVSRNYVNYVYILKRMLEEKLLDKFFIPLGGFVPWDIDRNCSKFFMHCMVSHKDHSRFGIYSMGLN